MIDVLQAILYSFPAICWLYGAGLLFSSFASLVFWGQPAAKLVEKLRTRFTTVVPVGLQVSCIASCITSFVSQSPCGKLTNK